MKELIGGYPYEHQQIRYLMPFVTPDIVIELDDGSKVRRHKKTYAYRVLSPEAAEQYKFSEKNFRYLMENQISFVEKQIYKVKSDISKKDLFRILFMCDLFVSKNPRNQWCVIAKRLFSSFFAIPKEAIDLFLTVLVQSKIYMMIDIGESRIYKIALSETDQETIETEITEGFDNKEITVLNVNRQKTTVSKIISKKLSKETEQKFSMIGIDIPSNNGIIDTNDSFNFLKLSFSGVNIIRGRIEEEDYI